MTDEQTIRAALDAETPAQVAARSMYREAEEQAKILRRHLAELDRKMLFASALLSILDVDPHADELTLFLLNQPAGKTLAGASGGFEAAPSDVASSSLSPSGLDASPSPESVAMTAADTSASGVLPGACGAEVPLPQSAGASPPGEPQGPPPVQMVAPLLSERASDESKHPEDMTIAEQAAWCFINGHGLEVNPWSESDPRYLTWIKCYRREKRKAEKTAKSNAAADSEVYLAMNPIKYADPVLQSIYEAAYRQYERQKYERHMGKKEQVG